MNHETLQELVRLDNLLLDLMSAALSGNWYAELPEGWVWCGGTLYDPNYHEVEDPGEALPDLEWREPKDVLDELHVRYQSWVEDQWYVNTGTVSVYIRDTGKGTALFAGYGNDDAEPIYHSSEWAAEALGLFKKLGMI